MVRRAAQTEANPNQLEAALADPNPVYIFSSTTTTRQMQTSRVEAGQAETGLSSPSHTPFEFYFSPQGSADRHKWLTGAGRRLINVGLRKNVCDDFQQMPARDPT
uniref:(northern house mosquito) hypothetical protein n=1 Tax=Culex pipiens TaxID=7175 RepID=A0A8D8MUS6_CULPI